MLKKKQKKYFDDLWTGASNHLREFLVNGNPEHLHGLRVAIKKLKALFTLAGNNEADIKRHFKPVKKIFKHAGRIRDAYNNLELSQQYHVDDAEFKNQQHLHIATETDQFKIKGPKYQKTVKKAQRAIAKDIDIIGSKHIGLFYNDTLTDVDHTLQRRLSDDELHANRRRIKTLIYNHKIIPKKLEAQLNIDQDYMDKLQTHIGNWHDTVVAVNNLNNSAPAPVITKIKNRGRRLKGTIKNFASDFKQKATAGNQYNDLQIAAS